MPEGQLASKARLIRAAGLRWSAEEGFESGKDYFGLDQCQARLYTAIRRHQALSRWFHQRTRLARNYVQVS